MIGEDYHTGVELGPGTYDFEGEVHIDPWEACVGFGWPPTDENQEHAAHVAAEVAASHGLTIEVVE